MEQLFLPLLLMLVVAVPLVLGTRKQKKAVQQQQELQGSLTAGDRVMTTSGMYATVADVSDESTIDLEIADGVVTTWLRQAVREKVDVTVDEDSDDETVDADAADTADTTVADVEASDTASDADTKVKADDVTASADSTAQVAPPLEHGKK